MAELVLPIVQMLCGIPGSKIIGPLIAPLIPFNIFNLIVLLIFILALYFGPKNSFVNGTDKGDKNFGTSIGWSFLFYYLSMFIIYLVVFQVVCKTANAIPMTP